MIKKNLNNSLVFSAKRNKEDQLVLIFPYKDLPEIEKEDGEITRVGINNLNCIEIHVISNENIIEYTLPYNEEIYLLIKRYNLNHVVVFLTKEENLSVNTKLNKQFEGFLKLYYIEPEK